VTVSTGPHQIVWQGETYLAGDTVPDVDHDEADRWITSGWATETAAKQTAPAKPAGRK
jgi:hypothetical protein